MQIVGRNAIIAVNEDEYVESVHPYLRGMHETSRDKNGKSREKMRPPGFSSGMWLPIFILRNAVAIAESKGNSEERILPLAPCRDLQVPS